MKRKFYKKVQVKPTKKEVNWHDLPLEFHSLEGRRRWNEMTSFK